MIRVIVRCGHYLGNAKDTTGIARKIDICIRICMYLCMYICMHLYMHEYIYTCIHCPT